MSQCTPKLKENEKNGLKKGRLGKGGKTAQNGSKFTDFSHFQTVMETVPDAENNRQTRRWKAEVPY